MDKHSEAYKYKRERSRIKRFVDRWTKKGVTFGADVYEIFKHRFSSDVLQTYTKERIFQNAYVTYVTGEKVSVGLKGRTIYKKPVIDMSDQIISNWFRMLNAAQKGEAYAYLMRWMDGLMATRTRQQIANMIQEGAENGTILTFPIIYSYNLSVAYMSAMFRHMEDMTKSEASEMFEAMDVYDYSGYFEDWE